MSDISDALHLHPQYPSHSADNHPLAAAQARAKIAGLPDPHTHHPEPELITDRAELAARLAPKRHAAQAERPPLVRHRRRLPSRLRPLLTGIGTFCLLLLLFKAPVIISQISYLHQPVNNSANIVTPPATNEVIPPEATITIPKINVHAPVIYDNSIDENQIEKDLENGVIHYATTALPGQNGNTVIFGHSSNDWWAPGNYKFVFVLLDKLQPGDQFSVDYNSKRYVYEVTGSKVVQPTDLSVLNPTSTPTMTLITCTPPGTSWQRLVVTAKQISPSTTPTPPPTVADQPSANATTLTSGQSGFGTQVSNALKGIWHSVASLFGGDKGNTPGELPAVK